jgi:multicomponent Na+:H+ antiporter subunit B
MSKRWRALLLAPALTGFSAVLIWGFAGLPGFGSQIGRYGRYIDHVAQQQRHVTNFVAAVMFDYRGVDTMIEEFILFASVMGTALLLRSSRDVASQRPYDLVTSDAVRVAGATLSPVLVLFGLWVIAFGYITPGGGFQGGVIAAAGALLLWLGGSYRQFRAASPSILVDAAEGVGAAAYVGIGLLGMATGGAFLANVIPLGTTGTLTSAGTIAALNWMSGIEVAAAFVLLMHEFMKEYVQTFPATKAEQ